MSEWRLAGVFGPFPAPAEMHWHALWKTHSHLPVMQHLIGDVALTLLGCRLLLDVDMIAYFESHSGVQFRLAIFFSGRTPSTPTDRRVYYQAICSAVQRRRTAGSYYGGATMTFGPKVDMRDLSL